MVSADEVVKLGERWRALGLPLCQGDVNAASLSPLHMLLRAQARGGDKLRTLSPPSDKPGPKLVAVRGATQGSIHEWGTGV